MGVLAKLHEHGLTVEAQGDRLIVAPSDRLDDELRQFIRQHKPDILRELETTLTPQQETAINRWLDHIGEFHEPSRADCLERCCYDMKARAYFLERAREAIN